MVEWHDVAFGIPKLGSLTDEQLEDLYAGRDGPWSMAMKTALRRFSADKLDLEENWASRSPDWECPGCGRRKPDLVRVSNNGVLLARLDIHHDHLTDYLKSILHGKLGPQWRATLPPDCAHIEKLGSRLVARFEPSTVCSDCNSADGAVKALSVSPEDVPGHFGWFAMFAGLDMPASSGKTRALLDWHPVGPDMLTDLRAMDYAAIPA